MAFNFELKQSDFSPDSTSSDQQKVLQVGITPGFTGATVPRGVGILVIPGCCPTSPLVGLPCCPHLQPAEWDIVTAGATVNHVDMMVLCWRGWG